MNFPSKFLCWFSTATFMDTTNFIWCLGSRQSNCIFFYKKYLLVYNLSKLLQIFFGSSVHIIGSNSAVSSSHALTVGVSWCKIDWMDTNFVS